MITINKNGGTYIAYGNDLETIQDRNLKRFVKKLANEPEIETAYWLGEFNLNKLEILDQEEISTQLKLIFTEDAIFNDDDESPSIPRQFDHNFINGGPYEGFS